MQKFQHGKCLLDSFDNIEHVYLIFTNNKEYLNFQMSYNKKINYYILQDYFEDSVIRKMELNKSIIQVKKLHFVNILIQFYDFVICLDGDFLVKDQNKFVNACQAFVNDKSFICGLSNFRETKRINQKSYNLLSKHKNFSSFNSFELYFWLSEIPIYEKNTTQDFLKFINYENNYLELIENFNFYFFDTICYNYYCMLEHNFKLITINYNFSLEDCPLEIWEKTNKEIKKLHSINHNIFNGQDVALLIHLDRGYGYCYHGLN